MSWSSVLKMLYLILNLHAAWFIRINYTWQKRGLCRWHNGFNCQTCSCLAKGGRDLLTAPSETRVHCKLLVYVVAYLNFLSRITFFLDSLLLLLKFVLSNTCFFRTYPFWTDKTSCKWNAGVFPLSHAKNSQRFGGWICLSVQVNRKNWRMRCGGPLERDRLKSPV